MRKIILYSVVPLFLLAVVYLTLSKDGKEFGAEKTSSLAQKVMTKAKPVVEDAQEPLKKREMNSEDTGNNETLATSVEIQTDLGNVVIKLFPEHAPNTVRDFIKLVKEGYYDGTIFFDMMAGLGIVGGKVGDYPFGDYEDEQNELHSKPGSVAVAKSAQFKTYLNNIFIGFSSQPESEQAYTIFGEVVKGLDILEKAPIGLKMNSVRINGEYKT